MFVPWPSRRGTPPNTWIGTHIWSAELGIGMSDPVGREIAEVVEVVSTLKPFALWLSGSVARGRMRSDSDIDWVIVADRKTNVHDGWPSARHAYHQRDPETFLKSLEDGDEFAVWQLAYGRALLLAQSFAVELARAEVADCRTAAARKRRLITRREQLVAVFVRCGDWAAVCTESLLISQQRARLLLLEHGVVPGCRDEVGEQLNAVAPLLAKEWRSETNAQLRHLLDDYNKRLVIKAASVARIHVPSRLTKVRA